MKHYEVVAAVIEYDNKILCMQRGKAKFEYTSYKFEFPGGKVEAGEENHTALERELNEEMDMNVSIREEDYLLTIEHIYPDFAGNHLSGRVCFLVPGLGGGTDPAGGTDQHRVPLAGLL